MLVDMHCHLCAGLDDGPQTLEEAAQMCRLAYAEGARWLAATAHQSDHWPAATPTAIATAAAQLIQRLQALSIPLCIRPVGEVMLCPELVARWDAGALLSYGDQKKYLLVEFPAGVFFDIRPLIGELSRRGVRLVLAHPERHPEMLFDFSQVQELIRLGCLVQVSATSLAHVSGSARRRALKAWVRGGVVHLIGSDGHSPQRRPPLLAAAHRRIAEWAGLAAADRIGSTNGLAVLQGLPLKPPAPQPPRRRRFLRFFG